MPEKVSEAEFRKSLFLLDGSALAYRAHFAMARSNLSNSRGIPTGATYGVTMELRRILEKAAPRYVALVMDTPEPTFRHKEFPEYKATRQRMPDELVEQLPLIKDAARVLGIPVLELPGYEADDVMGTIARRAEAQEIPVFLVTGDKDFMQIVSPLIRLYNIMKRDEELVIIDEAAVEERFGVEPARVVDVLGLMGDTSDNVPGIPGVGEKTAKKLIGTYGTLQKLLDEPGSDLSPRVRKNLEDFRDQGLLSKRLVTIDVNSPIEFSLEELEFRGPDRERARDLFQELGFTVLAQEMSIPEPGTPSEADYHMIRTEKELRDLVAALGEADLLAVDTETTSLNVREARIVGFSFAVGAGQGWYVPLNLKPPIVPDPPGAPRGQAVVEILKPLLEAERRTKCGQNVKYDLMVMANHGIRMAGVHTDTMIAAYLLEPHERERGLDALALRHFGYVKIKTKELIGTGKDQLTMDLVPVEDVGTYACEDADFTWRLAERFLQRLGDGDLKRLHDEVEIPLIDVLADMERTGIRVDRDQLKAMARDLDRQADAVEEKIHEAAGGHFNVNSPRQLGEVLFERLEIHKASGFKPKRTKTGWATGQAVLEALSDHPLPAMILEYRKLTKLLNTYIRPLPDLVDEETGHIHASFNQTVAATGRLSSSDPNLQNIPIRTEAGRQIRRAFLPSTDGHRLLAADYSQVELRIMAHLSEDEAMIEAFERGADIHRDTASRVFGVEPDEVDTTMRGRAKAINFGILYGMGPSRLSRETGLTLDEAKKFIGRYFEAFPAIRDFIEGLKDHAREHGFAETILGRRRPIPDIHSSNGMLRAAAENMAVNTPIQGSAADILKVAMVRIHGKLLQGTTGAHMILTVHDELVFDVPTRSLEEVQELVRYEMERGHDLRVPLKVDMGVGKNWLEAH